MSIQIKSTSVAFSSSGAERLFFEGAMPEAVQPGNAAETTDPRVLRSRRMLMEALARLLTQREFDGISIQEIADEATLNRATFYLHYPDKNALLQAMTAARFGELIARRGLSFTDCDGSLRAIALGVCDYLAESTGCPGQLAKMPLERSVIPVVEDVFRQGAGRHPPKPGVDRELLATTAAWAIYGAARRWYETRDRVPAEEMAAKIEAMVKPIFLRATE
jgi:AcrR family transcriptional regulator